MSKNSFSNFLSVATKYMVVAGAILKSLHPKLFHVTCEAHLLCNCATAVKSQLKMLIS